MTKPIFIQSNASDAELTTKAKEIGVPLKTLKNMLDYAQHLRDRADELDISPPQQVSALVTVIVDRIERHGLLVQVKGLIGKRGRGYVPMRELPEEGETKKKFSQGSEHEMKVIGTDRDGRLRLSVKGKLRDEERKAVQQYRKEAASKGFGTFGDLLKSKLEK